jgi:phage gpG-like protein
MSGIRMEGDWRRFENCLHKLVNFNFTGMHKEIGEAMVSSTRKRFKDEKGPDGKSWPKSIRAEEEGGQTLTDTAHLKNSVTSKASAEGVAWGTNHKTASTHQGKDGRPVKIRAKGKALKFRVGGKWAVKKTVTIPARPFIGISDADSKEIDGIIKDRIEETTR